MKTVYTDQYAVLLWGWLFLGTLSLVRAALPPLNWHSALWLFGSLVWFGLAIRELKRRRDARRRGEDPSIYKVVDDA